MKKINKRGRGWPIFKKKIRWKLLRWRNIEIKNKNKQVATILAQSVKRLEFRSLKEVQRNWCEFDSWSQHRREKKSQPHHLWGKHGSNKRSLGSRWEKKLKQLSRNAFFDCEKCTPSRAPPRSLKLRHFFAVTDARTHENEWPPCFELWALPPRPSKDINSMDWPRCLFPFRLPILVEDELLQLGEERVRVVVALIGLVQEELDSLRHRGTCRSQKRFQI